MDNKIENGDIYDIGQTVNGVSRFLWFNEKWYYFEERMSREYEYDQEDLTKSVVNEDGMGDISKIGNILTLVSSEVETNVLKRNMKDNMEIIEIYKFQMESIEDALRMTANAYGCRKKESCLDRSVTQAEQYAKNSLTGDIDKEVGYM